MSERSELLKKVLDTWEHSEEGRSYLEWLLRPEAENLDGGDVLREAVLDVVEEDDQLRNLRWAKAEKPLAETCADLPPESARVVRESSEAIFRLLEKNKEAVRKKTELLRNLRHGLNRDRPEALGLFAQIKLARERELPEVDEVIAACGGIPETTDVKELRHGRASLWRLAGWSILQKFQIRSLVRWRNWQQESWP
jgi:hypothetical protein